MSKRPQPKFSFGQKLIHKENKETFVVDAIIFHNNLRYMYLLAPESVISTDKYDGGYWEEDLEAYKEKRKINLFAHIVHNLSTDTIFQTEWTTIDIDEFKRKNKTRPFGYLKTLTKTEEI